MATRKEERIQITRITRTIPRPLSEVVAKLKSSINANSSNAAGGASILAHLSSKEEYEAAVHKALGPHGFMQFYEINHGAWMPMYGVHAGKGAVRIIFGNPLVAITMLRHDVRAGLYVPVECLIVEREDGQETEVIQIQPSTIIAGGEDSEPELKTAAEALDQKLEALWDWVAMDK